MRPARHVSEFVLRLLLFTSLVGVLGLIVWVPVSRVVIRVEMRRIVAAQHEHFLVDGGFASREALEIEGLPSLPGVELDSLAINEEGWYARLRHRLSPATCEFRGERFARRLACGGKKNAG